MRYTKYNYKKKKNNDVVKTILSFIAMSVFVVIVGVLLANIIIYFLHLNNASEGTLDDTSKAAISESTNGEVANNKENEKIVSSDQGNLGTTFAIIQCGYFSSSDNANVVLSKISSEFGAFIFNDNDKYKVLAGIYDPNNVDEVMNKLTAGGVECAKVTVNLGGNDEVKNQVAAICKGYLEILDTTFDNDVKFVETEDFKAWVANLDAIEEGENKEVLNSLKTHISELPSEIKKEDVAIEMQFLYTILINFN